MIRTLIQQVWQYKYWLFSVGLPLALLVLLLSRNPYSDRTLIGNFEPFPDTFHYVVPARELAQGRGFYIAREFGRIVPAVPPLYSIFLTPTWFFSQDARTFYFVNIVLALTSFALLAGLLRLMTNKSWLIGLTLLLWVTNWYTYWLPSLAMSENLLFVWILLMLVWVRLPLQKWSGLFAGLLVWLPYLTKFSAAPQTFIFGLIVLIRYWFAWKASRGSERKSFVQQFFGFFVITMSILLAYTLHDYLQSGTTLLDRFINVVTSVASSDPKIPSQGESFVAFSSAFVLQHFPGYLQAAFGKVTPFLWERTPVWEWWLAWFGFIGLAVSSKWNKHRSVFLSALALILAQILFMATFYVVDARYILPIFAVIPLGFVGFVETTKKRPWSYLVSFVFVFFCLMAFVMRAPMVRKTVAINLKYAETPWYMLSVKELDKALEGQESADASIAVISPLAPHLHDFYSSKKVKYHLLPLTRFQDFRTQSTREQLYGQDDYSDLLALYDKYLSEGYQVYIESYGLGNVSTHHEDYQNLMTAFKTEKIWSGCHGLCDVYKIIERK